MNPEIVAYLKFLRAIQAERHSGVVMTAPEKAIDALAEIAGIKITLG